VVVGVGDFEAVPLDVADPDAAELAPVCGVLAELLSLVAAFEHPAIDVRASKRQADATTGRIRFGVATTCSTVAGANHEAREANLPGFM
jgi:hypothetical protein